MPHVKHSNRNLVHLYVVEINITDCKGQRISSRLHVTFACGSLDIIDCVCY